MKTFWLITAIVVLTVSGCVGQDWIGPGGFRRIKTLPSFPANTDTIHVRYMSADVEVRTEDVKTAMRKYDPTLELQKPLIEVLKLPKPRVVVVKHPSAATAAMFDFVAVLVETEVIPLLDKGQAVVTDLRTHEVVSHIRRTDNAVYCLPDGTPFFSFTNTD